MQSLNRSPLKAVLKSFVLIASIAIPAQSWAGCPECGTIIKAIQLVVNASAAATDLTINTTASATNTNIDMTRSVLSGKIDTVTSALVGSLEKQSAANQQLKQAEISYGAQAQVVKVISASEDMFTAPSADLTDPYTPANTCATIATATAAVTASNNSSITAKALTSADARVDLYTTNASGMMQQKIADYKANFCSANAQKRGLCDTPVAAHMQDADTNGGSLLAPAGGGTYSKDEAVAARSLIKNLAGSVPQESLPIVLEKTPAGQRYVVEQRSMAAVKNMAAFSLNSIFSANNAEDTSSGAAAANKLSVVGLMKKFVEDRFGDPKYIAALGTLGPEGMLRQIAENMAFQSWMEYNSYLQGERTEGLLATQLALNARERSDKTLSALRAQASNLNAR